MHSLIIAFVLSSGITAHAVAAPPANLPSAAAVSPAMGNGWKCSAPQGLATDSTSTVRVCEVSK